MSFGLMMLGLAKKYILMSGKIESYTNAKLTRKKKNIYIYIYMYTRGIKKKIYIYIYMYTRDIKIY